MSYSIVSKEQFRHLVEVNKEYKNAKTKHPFFANKITHFPADEWAFKETIYKERNDQKEKDGISDWFADEILAEEVAEAFHAAAKGETEHAKQEFYQIAAVCLRCIDLLETTKNANTK